MTSADYIGICLTKTYCPNKCESVYKFLRGGVSDGTRMFSPYKLGYRYCANCIGFIQTDDKTHCPCCHNTLRFRPVKYCGNNRDNKLDREALTRIEKYRKQTEELEKQKEDNRRRRTLLQRLVRKAKEDTKIHEEYFYMRSPKLLKSLGWKRCRRRRGEVL